MGEARPYPIPTSNRPGGGSRAATQLPAYLTGPGSPSMQLTTWNFSRSQNRMVLQRQSGCAGKPVSLCWPPHRPVAWEAYFSANACLPGLWPLRAMPWARG